MPFDAISPGTVINGPLLPEAVEIMLVTRLGSSLRVRGKGLQSGMVHDTVLTAEQVSQLTVSAAREPLDGDAALFRLGIEAQRLGLAYEYDPYFSLSIARVDPLPHQLEAVYEYFLKLPRIRFLLADDPGAGKTIMAGLLLKELKARGLVKRTLVVTPANLTFQWQRELRDKFRETFEVINSDVLRANYGQNPWQDRNQAITSISWVSRIDDAKESLLRSRWDLVIVDEAHKMAAYADDRKTLAFQLGEALSGMTDHLLLMTATPHKGDPENFCLFLSLLDKDVYGNVESLQQAMRQNEAPFYLRRIKEALVSFPDPETGEIKKLFTRRQVNTADFQLDGEELEFYDALTRYVEDQSIIAAMDDSARGRAVGFTMVMLQRRMASTVYAVRRSLERMRDRREKVLADPEAHRKEQIDKKLPDDFDELTEEEQSEIVAQLEDVVAVVDPAALKEEIARLNRLVAQACQLEHRQIESKLTKLRSLLNENGFFSDPQKKLLIFTEHKDSLDFLAGDGRDGRPLGKLREWGLTVTVIHGGMKIGDRDTPGSRIYAEREFRDTCQILVATEAAGLRTFTYDNAGRMLSEEIASTTNSANLLWGVEVTNTYDGTTKLRTSHTVERSTLSKTVNYGYDDWRRLDHVQKDTLHARFAYHPVTGQVVKTTYIHNDDDPDPQESPVVVGDRAFDRLGRLKSINWTTNTLADSDVASAAYEHDAFGRRIRMTTTPAPDEGVLFWEYGYDELNQLVVAQHYWTDGEDTVTIPGEKFGFGYDQIGNRLFTQEGGDDEGQDTYLSTYTSNLLNQYTLRDVSGNVEVVGRTSSESVLAVTVNSNQAWLEHRMFHKRLTFNNASDPVVGTVNVLEIPGLSSSSKVFLPEDPEEFWYDADGNLTRDGVWHYEWDAENRLKAMQMRDEVAQVLLTGSDRWARIEFAYDWMGRRISKMYQTTNDDPAVYGTKTGPPITWSIDRCVRYVWDGWHLSLSYRVQGNGAYLGPDQSFAWGPDLSSSYGGAGGAGGVGGLVAYCDDDFDTNNPTNDPDLGPMYPIYDGNGNVVRMCRFVPSAGDWDVECRTAAAYEYGPFGESLSVTGEDLGPSGGGGQGQRNPFRFSTKYTDAETGLVYYGYRYYSPSMGRWVSRDPIAEQGGVNIFGFVANDPVGAVDPLGLWKRNDDWRMISPGKYTGTATREDCLDNDLAVLAYNITGNRMDSGLLRISGRPLRNGMTIDISPLLRVLEMRLRSNAVRNTRRFASGFPVRPARVPALPGQSEAVVRSYFGGGGGLALDCKSAIMFTLAKSLIDELKPLEYDRMFANSHTLRMFERRDASGSDVKNGDWVVFQNSSDYREGNLQGDWANENALKVGPDRYWGHGLGSTYSDSVRSSANILEHLRQAYIREKGHENTSNPPSMSESVTFLNVIRIAQKTFDYRQGTENWHNGRNYAP